MKITIKCSSPYYYNHSDTVTASKLSQDAVPVLWNWHFLLKKRVITKKNQFSHLAILTKLLHQIQDFIPSLTWKHTNPRGILLLAFLALLSIKTFFLMLMMFSSSAQGAKFIVQKEKLQYVQGNTASLCLFCPNRHTHTLVHPDVSQHTITKLYLPLVSKVLMLLISFPEYVLQQEISHFPLIPNQKVLQH